MTGEVEAAGEIATGALLARAVDGAADSHGRHGGQCLNCGTALIGSHCHRCGQSGHIHRSLGAIWHDLAHGVLHVEGKIWRTLPLLIVRPGELTRRYVTGERVRFLSPLALFLFSVFLMFATISALGGDIVPPDMNPQQRATTLETMNLQLQKADGELARIDRERAAALKAGRSTAELDEQRSVVEATKQGLDVASAEVKNGENPGFTDLRTGIPRLDKGIAKANANPGLLVYKLQSSAYKFSWALIPISVPFVALLFLWRRGHRMYDHAVFVTYSLSFMTLLVIALSIAGAAGLGGVVIATVATFAPPLHMYKQLRGAYRLRRFSALWRTIFLISFAFVALLFFLFMLLGMGLMG
ncbi:DUF3667 domain-containing protein [Sphingomonas gilva]|uniref:DUF3667 domain-containing protein n=1 Tax=Sphingomonas gilva TaxID=2305907 RepID=A0A396RKI1_9SPHN|nr:DUF3667 domain-containing protein [Sphingomonas gilva]RHW16777.1 DUF3667 domain-containing protein [Sphingomonas gilva]